MSFVLSEHHHAWQRQNSKTPEETKQTTCPKKRDGILQEPQVGLSKEQKPNEKKEEIKTADKPVRVNGRMR